MEREKVDVNASEIKDYAMSLGWTLVKEALAEGQYLLNSPKHDYAQLMFPMNSYAPEFNDAAWNTLQRLAVFYQTTVAKVLSAIREVNDDVLALRYYADSFAINSITFQEALDAIEGTRQLLLSAASSVVNPAIYHPRLNRAEPQELLKKARFRHTQEGSFIIQVACPFEMSVQENLLGPEKPLSRNTMELINTSASMVKNAAEIGNSNELYLSEMETQRPTLSYNFCDALSKLFAERQELPFELQFRWSKASMQRMPIPNLPSAINFPFSYRKSIEDIRSYFMPKKRDVSAKFVGSVETLDGEFEEEDRRSGYAVLLLLHDEELLKARVYLNADEYAIALHVHQTPGAYIQLRGDLKRGKQRHTIVNISEFKISE